MSISHWLLVALVVLVLFGGRRLGDIGKGLGEGIKNFKKGLTEDDKPDKPDLPRQVTDAKVIDEKVDEAKADEAKAEDKQEKS